MKIKVGVIFGGCSVEHEISIISALQAMDVMDLSKYEIVPIYISKDKEWYTGEILRNIDSYKDTNSLFKKARKCILYHKNHSFVLQSKNKLKSILSEVDLAFPIVHGANVEDGTLSGYLETIGIPYVGSNVLSGAISQDKVVMKDIFKSNNLPIVPYIWFYDTNYFDNEKDILSDIKSLGYPVIVKPCSLGSSIGIGVAYNEMEVKEAIEVAINYDYKIVVEKVVPNLLEVNCSVLGNYENSSASEIEEVMGNDEFLSYQDKYFSKSKTKGMASTKRVIPARISKELKIDIQNTSLKVFKVLNSSGVVRIDYLIDSKEGLFYVNEINSIPGSLSFYLWESSGKHYKDLIDDLINVAIKNYKKRENKLYSLDTNILESMNGTKGSKGKI